jgi:hypothetical protein
MGQTFAADWRAAHPDERGPDGKIKVCVGGGAGFIGSHIAKRLREEVSKHRLALLKYQRTDVEYMLCSVGIGLLRNCR